ncbi:LCP family protein [Halobacillus salinarum]|uniref:LCP family protein n=1 Tax=Halobacillus salinarum TaxID=2932257 RepID=A0ABY4EMN4_9BACI|nr:LCP family protein [Halobacillus salinarum]UOQ45712.1 LCP family protein [Halobacillus salinarum]
MSSRKERKQHKKKSWTWLKVLGLTIVFLALAGGVYAYSIWSDAKDTVNKEIHKSVDSIETSVTKKKMKEQKPINVLLLGVDERKNDSGRSDALMVMSLDPKEDKMQLISIPRDTRTQIVGKGFEDKINHAYAFGGTEMSINTVENFLDIDLDYYVKLNMEGLSEMVDAVGGITVHNNIDWYDEGYYKKGYHYAKGDIQLNGEKTMGYVRMRHLDPRGDFGRNERQRQVIQAIIDKGANVGSVSKIGSVLDVLGSNVKTNMEFSDMKNLFFNYRSTRKNVTTYEMSGHSKYINDIYYLMVPQEEVSKVHNMIKELNS